MISSTSTWRDTMLTEKKAERMRQIKQDYEVTLSTLHQMHALCKQNPYHILRIQHEIEIEINLIKNKIEFIEDQLN
jgi:hypothetical protein